ncbi:ABC transporter transmembrane region, partial [Corynebacterium efficiens YS-314]
MSKPLDPRLVRLSAPTRRWIIIIAILTAAKSVATVVMGVLIGVTTAGAIEHGIEQTTLNTQALTALVLTVLIRGALAWAEARFAERAANEVVVDLRARTLTHLAHSDPRTVDQGRWRTLLGHGIEGLGPYLTGYLPALAATVIATPLMLAVVWYLDTGSMLIALVTLPLIPVFMWLVGTLTAGLTERRLADLSALSDQLLDLIAGLPTLRVFRRHRDMAREVDRLSHNHATSTLHVLKIAFLSSFVLEFLATLSVAIVAVTIGFRLLAGELSLVVGLTVLIIIPEVYAPIRQVGARFHDAQDGLAASGEILDLLSSTPADTPSRGEVGASTSIRVVFDQLTATGRDGDRPDRLSGVAEPGQLTVLWGPNGSGKTTALLAVLGIATEGVTGRAEALTPEGPVTGPALWEHCVYLPQRPVLDPTSIGDEA